MSDTESTSSSWDGKIEDRVRAQGGQVLKWKGPPHLNLGIGSLVNPPESPGILHPRRPRLPLFDETGLEPLYDLKLVRPQTDGKCHTHQVWRCKAGPHRLILKFDDRWLHNPLFKSFPTDIDAVVTEISPELSAKREARAYDMVQPAQGSLVPYYYGCWVFTMLDGRDYLGHVLEYIDGMLPHDWMETYGGRSELDAELCQYSLMRAVLEGATELHKMDVLHCDLRVWNVLVIPPYDVTQTPYIVILDFNMAQPISTRLARRVSGANFERIGLYQLLAGSGALALYDRSKGDPRRRFEAKRLWETALTDVEDMTSSERCLTYWEG